MLETALWVQARPVTEMFRHINLQRTAVYPLNRLDSGDGLALADTGAVEPPAYLDKYNEDKYFVFVHGFNVSGAAAEGWHSEVFKRLYRLGFNGRFVGVTWHGDTGGTRYHDATYNAFQTSRLLKSEIAQKTNGSNNITIAAHSLGNVLVSNAIAYEGLNVDNYYMINAAAPIEAYDSSQEQGACDDDNLMKNCMVENSWKAYPDEVASSEWHALFNDGDPRKKLTWKNRFESVLPYAYNFYSPGEDVVEDPFEGEDAVDAGVLLDIYLTGRHAWVTQEISKGCKAPISLATTHCQGGWGYNLDESTPFALDIGIIRDGVSIPNVVMLTPSQLASGAITNEHLAQYGFFKPFENRHNALYAPTHADVTPFDGKPDYSEMEGHLNDKTVAYELLASAIPARSYAVAANALSSEEIVP